MKSETYMTDRVAVLLARAECRDNPAALQVCDMFLRMMGGEDTVAKTHIELTQPREE